MAGFPPRLGDGGQEQSVRTGRRPPRSGALAGGAELRQRAVMPLSPPPRPSGLWSRQFPAFTRGIPQSSRCQKACLACGSAAIIRAVGRSTPTGLATERRAPMRGFRAMRDAAPGQSKLRGAGEGGLANTAVLDAAAPTERGRQGRPLLLVRSRRFPLAAGNARIRHCDSAASHSSTRSTRQASAVHLASARPRLARAGRSGRGCRPRACRGGGRRGP
jgi:hypothetical protein